MDKVNQNKDGWCKHTAEMRKGEVQTRSEETGLRYFKTIAEAFDHSEKDKTVWKITLFWQGEVVRLAKEGNRWVYTDIMRYAEAIVLNKEPEEVCEKKMYRCDEG